LISICVSSNFLTSCRKQARRASKDLYKPLSKPVAPVNQGRPVYDIKMKNQRPQLPAPFHLVPGVSRSCSAARWDRQTIEVACVMGPSDRFLDHSDKNFFGLLERSDFQRPPSGDTTPVTLSITDVGLHVKGFCLWSRASGALFFDSTVPLPNARRSNGQHVFESMQNVEG
jgi:hypothetical protein